MTRIKTSIIAIALILIGLLAVASYSGALKPLSKGLSFILNPTGTLTIGAIILISFILGLLHGATPDEHTWPITFSYAIGSYSTKKGAKAGFVFSSGFTVQRAILSTLGFIGLAAIYAKYNLDGPVYFVVGVVMLIAGIYILNKKRYIHLPIDALLMGKQHHSEEAKRIKIPTEKEAKPIPLKMALLHGFVAGWGFGTYATIIVFILAPKVPSLIYAPLPGLFFGLGTMVMQIIFGAIFANIAKIKRLTDNQIKSIGNKTAGRTLYYGGMVFAIFGLLIIAFPILDKLGINTGNPIPNLNAIGPATMLVIVVVGLIGIGGLISDLIHTKSAKEVSHLGN